MIKLLVCDVDGTLTDGLVYLGSNGIELKAFSVKDGLALKALPKLGIQVLLLTGRTSEATVRRAAELGVELLDNISDKKSALLKYLAEKSVDSADAAYIGDDINDCDAMKLCGFKACPADAVAGIKAISDYTSPFGGGKGAVRDICDTFLLGGVNYYE
jgi:3-deoxy-D-manno-octulosonate 8-phosphate phosphatase (KDO 8-P phosphatase)